MLFCDGKGAGHSLSTATPALVWSERSLITQAIQKKVNILFLSYHFIPQRVTNTCRVSWKEYFTNWNTFMHIFHTWRIYPIMILGVILPFLRFKSRYILWEKTNIFSFKLSICHIANKEEEIACPHKQCVSIRVSWTFASCHKDPLCDRTVSV